MQDPNVLLTISAIETAPQPLPRGPIRHEARTTQAKAFQSYRFGSA